MCEYCEEDKWNSLIRLERPVPMCDVDVAKEVGVYDWAEVGITDCKLNDGEIQWSLNLESRNAYQAMHGHLNINFCPICGRCLVDLER